MVAASDGPLLHVQQGGTATTGHPIVFVPGWTMPGWIWADQMRRLGRRARVLAMDPRAQGGSPPAPGMDLSPERRARDIGEVLAHTQLSRVVLVGWSLGAVEVARYARLAPPGTVSGIVLVDEPLYDLPSRAAARDRFREQLRINRAVVMDSFVRGMFHRPPAEAFARRLTAETMKTPLAMSLALLGGETGDLAALCGDPGPPVMAILSPRWREQGRRFGREHPAARVEVVPSCGHAVFIDAPDRFASLIEAFAGSLHP